MTSKMHSFLTLILLVVLLLFKAHAQERNQATKSIHSSVADMINKASKKIDKTFVPSKPKPVPKGMSSGLVYVVTACRLTLNFQ